MQKPDWQRVLETLKAGGVYTTYQLASICHCQHNSVQRALWQLRQKGHLINSTANKETRVKSYNLV